MTKFSMKLASAVVLISMLLSGCGVSPAATPGAAPKGEQPAGAAGAAEQPTAAAGDTAQPADKTLNVPLVSETYPPALISWTPGEGLEMPLDGALTLTFDQPMARTETEQAVQVVGADGLPVEGRFDWPSDASLQFRPAQGWLAGAAYQAAIGEAAQSKQGMTLGKLITLAFQTEGRLQVSQVFPKDGTVDIVSSTPITIIFDRPVVALQSEEDLTPQPNPLSFTPAVEGSGQWVNTSVYSFYPSQPLKSSTLYEVTVKAGLAEASGDPARSLAADYRWSFSTSKPQVFLRSLQGDVLSATNVPLDAGVALNFTVPMDKASVLAAIRWTDEAGTKVPFALKSQAQDTLMEVRPLGRLKLESWYTFTLDGTARSKDGSSLAGDSQFRFLTQLAPAVLLVRPENAGTDSQPIDYSDTFEIQFASPMNFNSVKSRLVISPKPEQQGNLYYDPGEWRLTVYGLKPSTDYEIRLLSGMSDLYGNTIRAEQTIRFRNGGLMPSAWINMPQAAIYRPQSAQEFYVNSVNVPEMTYELYRLSMETYIDRTANQYGNWVAYQPSTADLVWKLDEKPETRQDGNVLRPVKFSGKDGKPLPVGMYFLGMKSSVLKTDNPYWQGMVLMVADANLTFKLSAAEGLVWLTDMESGKPLSDAPVQIYDYSARVLAKGVTDADGLYRASLPVVKDDSDGRVAVVQSGQHFAVTDSNIGSATPIDSYYVSRSSYLPNRPMAYAYTERPLYRPGQPVYFKGIVRLDNDQAYSLPTQKEVEVVIQSFDEEIYREKLPLSEYGSFDGTLKLDAEAALGQYTLQVRFPNQDTVIGSTDFSVAEYRRVEMLADVQAAETNVPAGRSFAFDIAANYLSGGGVGGATMDWTLSAEPYFYTPEQEALQGYNFVSPESYRQSYRSGTLAEGRQQLDADGKYRLTIPANLGKVGVGQRYVLEATITDTAGAVVTGRAVVIAHPSQYYIGIRPKSYVSKVGDATTFEMIVVDWNGTPQADRLVSGDVAYQQWLSVQQQDGRGSLRWVNSIKEVPVARFAALKTDEKGRVDFAFTPTKGGEYIARASVRDEKGAVARSSAYVWVASDAYTPWMQDNSRQIQMTFDQTAYKPGDTAEVLLASPFQGDVYALVTVERGTVRSAEVLKLSNNNNIYRLPITGEMAPGVYLSVLMIQGVTPTSSYPTYAGGKELVKVDAAQKKLQIQLTPDRPNAGPGEEVTYRVEIKDAQGKPVAAEVSLALSDVGTLALKDRSSPFILDYFYQSRYSGVTTAVPLWMLVDEYNQSLKKQLEAGERAGSGGGGKGGGEAGVINVRQDFPDTAYWGAHVVTDESGKAEVRVRLPDNLTTWRMEARAATLDTRVGEATVDLISSKPLLVRPQTPRFLVVGDQAQLGTAVHNNTDEVLKVEVVLEASGVTLTDPAVQQVTIAARDQAFVKWGVTVPQDAARADLVFKASGGGFTDASRPTLGTLNNQGIPVYRYDAPETVGTSGALDEGGSVSEVVRLPQNVQANPGDLTVELTPTLAGSMTGALSYLEHYPYECMEQTISRFLPNILSLRAFRTAGVSNPANPDLERNLAEQVNIALQRIAAQQNADGGWGWWSGQESQSLTSAYVLLGLIEAKAADYAVSEQVVERAVDYLTGQLRMVDESTARTELNRQAFIGYVLKRAGVSVVNEAGSLYTQRQAMDWYARGFLAQTLAKIDPKDERLATLISDFAGAAVLSASGAHWEEKSPDVFNWNTDVRTTAVILDTLVQIDPKNKLNAAAVRWLMVNRTGNRWGSTQETAWSLMALTNWITASGELNANYSYALALNGVRELEGQVNPQTLLNVETLKVALTDLLANEPNRLNIGRTAGDGQLYYTAYLRTSQPVPDLKPLSRGVSISRAYYRPDNPLYAVKKVRQGELVMVRLTVVAPHDLHYVVIDDPLPAGLEAVDSSLNTSPQEVATDQPNWEDVSRYGWGWWVFNHVELRDEKVVLSADILPAGTYQYTYLARASTPGTYQVIPPTGQEFYFPDVYGRGAGSLFTVQ